MRKTTHDARQDETFVHKVGLPLTTEELLKRGSEIANLNIELERAEAEFATRKEQHKATVTSNTAQQKTLLNEIHTKKAYSAIECYNDFDHDRRRCSIRRTDTNEEVDWRAMTKEELERPALEFDKRRRATMRLADSKEEQPAAEVIDDEQELDKAA